MEEVTIAGTSYRVIGRKAVADMRPGTFWRNYLSGLNIRGGAKGRVSLVKARNGRHVYEAIEYGDGSFGQPTNTGHLESGASIKKHGWTCRRQAS